MLSRRAAVEVADYRHRLLLRARSERPRRHRAGEKNYQVASPHAGSLALTANRDYGSKGPPRIGWAKGSFPSVDAPLQAREKVGIVAARGRMLSSVRPWMRQEDSRRPIWEFADRVQITHSVLEARWKPLVVPAPSRRLLRHTLLPLALTFSRSSSAYAAAVGVL